MRKTHRKLKDNSLSDFSSPRQLPVRRALEPKRQRNRAIAVLPSGWQTDVEVPGLGLGIVLGLRGRHTCPSSIDDIFLCYIAPQGSHPHKGALIWW